ncbi:MAG TPA: M48 family metallopeptidase [Ignavibacteria bacterium]|nr:M48 family metallopeptidase [Ignavibacteria bacterium]
MKETDAINLSEIPEDTHNENRAKLAKKYSKINQIISLSETVIFFAITVIFIAGGYSKEVEELAFSFTTNDYAAVLIFFGIFGIIQSVITFPLSFYSDYTLEHKYGLSNQTIPGYFKEKIKGMLIGLLLGIPLLLIFYFIIKNYSESWWLILGAVMFFFSVIIGRLAPTLIMPLFYKFKPLENEEIKQKILSLCEKTGVRIRGIFEFDMSKNTKKANAAFTGIGKSKRIILGDTLLKNFSPEEIETVFAHEMGHYKKRHIMKLMTVSVVMTFAGLYLTSLAYSNSLNTFGFNSVSEIAALPLLFIYLSLFGLITSPISNILSRKFEWEADTFAIETTRDKGAFISAMEKLADQNLADKTPNKIIEFLFHSHPSIDKRIKFAEDYKL